MSAKINVNLHVKSMQCLSADWVIDAGYVCEVRQMYNRFRYSIDDAKALRDWLNGAIDELEGAPTK